MNKLKHAQQMSARRALRRAVLAGLGVLVAAPAIAQSSGEPVKLNKTVVTGSNIPTADTVGAIPVETYSAAAMEKRGVATVEQLVKQLPSAVGAGNFGVSRGNGGDGTSQISLRAVPGGTLVLINGRRMATNGRADNGANVDLNAIPVGAIERIEILKDGASAVYGADAVAGVVNVILKKDYNGFEINTRYGNTTDTDVGEQQYSFITGVANETTSVLIGGSFYKVNSLYSVDRERSSPDLTDPSNTSGTSNPGRIRTAPAGAGGIPAGGLVYRGAMGTSSLNPADYTAYNAGTDRFPFPLYTPAIRPAERWNIFGNGEHSIFGENLKFFTEGSYTRTLSYNQLAPTPIVFPNLTTGTSPNGLVIPATNPYNPFGVPITSMLYRAVELGPRTENQTGDVFRFVSGLKGQIGDSTWNWESAMLYAEDSRLEVLGGELSRSALEAAINDPNPATAFNPFGNRANGAAQLANVQQELITRGKTTLFSVDAKAAGEIVDLPAGPLASAFGIDHRTERSETTPDSATQRADTVGFNSNSPLKGSRDVEGAFFEVNLPITAPSQDIPVLHKLDISAAGRYDYYSDFGDTFNPKISVRWQPLDEQVTLRASYAESFKAPVLNDLYTGQSEDFPELRNPVKFAAGAPDAFSQIRTFRVGNINLKPETATSYTAGVIYSPKQIKNLTFSVDYFRIEQEDIAGSPDQYILDRNYETGGPTNPGAAFANLIQYDPLTQDYLSLTSPTFNLSRRIIEGLDTTASYVIPTESAGTFTLTSDIAYYLSVQQEDLPGTGLRDRLGDFVDPSQGFGLGSLPRFKGSFSGFWSFRMVELGLTTHYISSYLDDIRGGFDREVEDQLTFDIQASVNLPWKSRVTVGVINVTDEAPPLVLGAFADRYDRDTHDLRQRFVYVNFNKKF